MQVVLGLWLAQTILEQAALGANDPKRRRTVLWIVRLTIAAVAGGLVVFGVTILQAPRYYPQYD
jgi:hypothetical protein